MRIKVKVQGHRLYREVEGEPLLWAPTIVRGGERGELMHQVPSVLVKTDEGRVVLVPLVEQYQWTEIEWTEAPKP